MNPDILKRLVEPFHPSDIQWKAVAFPRGRRDRALVAPFYDVRLIYQRLDDVLGPMNWQIRHRAMESGGVYTEIGIWDETQGWIWKGDVGMAEREKRKRGSGTEEDPEEEVVLDATKAKGDATDGAKRAAAVWGIGRVYWLVPKDWCDWNDQAREPMPPPTLPDYALPYDMQKGTESATASGKQPKPASAAATKEAPPPPPGAVAVAAPPTPADHDPARPEGITSAVPIPAPEGLTPADHDPARPYAPEDVRRRLDAHYVRFKKDPNLKPATTTARGILAGLMESCFPKGEAVAARRTVLMYFFAEESVKPLNDAHVAALTKYIDARKAGKAYVVGPYVAVELRQIVAFRIAQDA